MKLTKLNYHIHHIFVNKFRLVLMFDYRAAIFMFVDIFDSMMILSYNLNRNRT